MKFVGEAHARYNPEAPLLGISSLGAVAGGPPLRKKAMCVSAGTDDGDHDDDALKYDDLVNSAPREQGDALLDPNHSHFLLVDNKQNGVEAFGCERALRAVFETCAAGSLEQGYPVYVLQGFEGQMQSFNGQRVLSATVLGTISALQAIKVWDKGKRVKGDVILNHHPDDIPAPEPNDGGQPWFAAPVPIGMRITSDENWKCQDYWCDVADKNKHNVCSALQAIWLLAGAGRSTEHDPESRVYSVLKRAEQLNEKIKEERRVLTQQEFGPGLEDANIKKIEQHLERKINQRKFSGLIDSPAAVAGNAQRGGRGGVFTSKAKEEPFRLFIRSMKTSMPDLSAEEILDVHSLTLPSEFSYNLPEGEDEGQLKYILDKWLHKYKHTMQTEAHPSRQERGYKQREIFNSQRAHVKKDWNISESQLETLFAKRLEIWKREEREVLVTLQNTTTIACKIKNLRRLSASEVQHKLATEMSCYSWKQSSRTFVDDDDNLRQRIPLVSITVQGGPGSGKQL